MDEYDEFDDLPEWNATRGARLEEKIEEFCVKKNFKKRPATLTIQNAQIKPLLAEMAQFATHVTEET